MNLSKRTRARQFGITRRSYSRSINNKSVDNYENLSPSPYIQLSRVTHSHEDGLVCVDCYNKKLSLEKHRKQQKRREEQSKSQMMFSKMQETNLRNEQLVKLEVQKINDYNVKKIQQNARKKEEQKRAIIQKQSQDLAKVGGQYKNQQDYRKQLNQQRRNQLRMDLQKQITFAKERRQRQLEQQKNAVAKPFIESNKTPTNRIVPDDSYKQQLLQQISLNRIKKKQEEQWQRQQNNRDNQLQFVRNADNRRQISEQIQFKNKETTKDEIRKKSQLQNARRQTEAKQRQRENLLRQQEQQQISVTVRREEEERRSQIEKYLRDLKQQMKENQARREEEFKWIKKQSNNSILTPRPNPPSQPCTSCSKPYPKQHLATFIAQKET